MLLKPLNPQFHAQVETLCASLLSYGLDCSISSPIDDTSTCHVATDTFYSVLVQAIVDSGLQFFIHEDLRYGLCCVVYAVDPV